jgi:hypothetical protein
MKPPGTTGYSHQWTTSNHPEVSIPEVADHIELNIGSKVDRQPALIDGSNRREWPPSKRDHPVILYRGTEPGRGKNGLMP